MNTVDTEPGRERVVAAWCTITKTYNEQADLLLCAAPYMPITVSYEGDDYQASRSNYDLRQLVDTRDAINDYLKIPSVEAQLTYLQEMGQ